MVLLLKEIYRQSSFKVAAIETRKRDVGRAVFGMIVTQRLFHANRQNILLAVRIGRQNGTDVEPAVDEFAPETEIRGRVGVQIDVAVQGWILTSRKEGGVARRQGAVLDARRGNPVVADRLAGEIRRVRNDGLARGQERGEVPKVLQRADECLRARPDLYGRYGTLAQTKRRGV